MPRRHLLLLGSNLPAPERVQAAVAELATLGSIKLLTPITRTPARHDPTRHYYNAIAELESALAAEPLGARLKAIEARLGRVRGVGKEVAIDIDLLATAAADGWQANPHALAKREFTQSPARELLAQAGIAVTGSAT